MTTPGLLAHRLRSVSEAWRSGEEDVIRAELRLLSEAAAQLASGEQLVLSPLHQRQRIASEREPTGRGAS